MGLCGSFIGVTEYTEPLSTCYEATASGVIGLCRVKGSGSIIVKYVDRRDGSWCPQLRPLLQVMTTALLV